VPGIENAARAGDDRPGAEASPQASAGGVVRPRAPQRFELPEALRLWWRGYLATHRERPDLAVAATLERGLRLIILPSLPRDAAADLGLLAHRLAGPLVEAVLGKMAQRFAREAKKGPHHPVRAYVTATLDVIVQALLWTYARLLEDRALHPRDRLAVRVERLCARPLVLPSKKGHRSRTVGDEYEWWLVAQRDRVRLEIRARFPGQLWGRKIGPLERCARLLTSEVVSALPEAVCREASEEKYPSEATLLLTSAWVHESPETIRRVLRRQRRLIRLLDNADRLDGLE
jgi:hypothetical protein